METELWDQKALDFVVPAYVRFDRQGMGEMQLIAIGASIDYRVEQRDGASILEFSWSGFDEMDATSGRAWARPAGGHTCRLSTLIQRTHCVAQMLRRQMLITKRHPRAAMVEQGHDRPLWDAGHG